MGLWSSSWTYGASHHCFATDRIRYGDPRVHGHACPRAAARDAPRRTDGVLLPDARVSRRRGRRAGDLHPRMARVRPLRGPLRAPLLAVPDRDQRLLRHARQPQAPGAADGSRACRRADRREPADAGPDSGSSRCQTVVSSATPIPRTSSPAVSRCVSRSSPRSSTCRLDNVRFSSSVRCFAGRRARSPSCWKRVSLR